MPGNPPLTNRQLMWIEKYLLYFNSTKAAREVGYKTPSQSGYENLKNPLIQKILQERLSEFHMSADEALKRLSEIARSDLGDFLFITKDGFTVDLKSAKEKTKLIKRVKQKTTTYSHKNYDRESHTEEIELYSALEALDKILRIHGKYNDTLNINTNNSEFDFQSFAIPADKITPSFAVAYRDIVNKKHTEYVFKGGRGSTKSSFVAEAFIYLLVHNPKLHGLALRQVADTLRDSVYARLKWAIGELGLSDKFKCTTSPMEIEYISTGQKIYFRGVDDPGKIKSITPTFGYIGLVWFEEFDQFVGMNAVRMIEQSIRGGDDIFYFKSWNPRPTKNNWANKYLEIPKVNRYVHHSTYLDVPPEWLGKPWLDEAEHLKNTNIDAYNNEYLGESTDDGGMIFTNVVIREITDEEIKEFDRILDGLDWGFYPDPASYGKMHYDSARRTLYIFGELRKWKKSNEQLHKALLDSGLYEDNRLLIADSAEPKSVGDFRAYGANCKGAEKGPESVEYSMKWLRGLTAIVIDQTRAPYHADEFLGYEFERTKDGEIISEYPDKNNHAIDDVRYATNLIWRRKGE